MKTGFRTDYLIAVGGVVAVTAVLAPFPEQAREFRSWARTAKRQQAAMAGLRKAGVVEGWLRRYADEVTFGGRPLEEALAHAIADARSKGHVSQGAPR